MAARKRQSDPQVTFSEQNIRKATLQKQLKSTSARRDSEPLARTMEPLEWPSKSRASTRRSISNRKSDFSYLDSGDSGDEDNRLQIAWEGETSETQSNHSEGSESSGTASSSSAPPSSAMVAANTIVRHPLSRWNALITLQNREIPVVYHKNMARTFPGTARTPEQLEMRRRNTEAARISRAKAKMAEMLMEKEAADLGATNEAVKRMVAAQLVYANALCRLLELPPMKLNTFKRIGLSQQQTENVEQNPSQELTEQSNASEPADDECAIKHPLQHTWTLWYLEMDRNKSWTDSMNEVTSFSTVEDFWSLFNHIRGPSEIKAGGDYMLFKSHIRPMWEDEANKSGGRWTVNVTKNLSDKYWLDTVLCLIGEAFEHSDQICGAIVNVRPRNDKISIWTTNSQNRDAVMDIGRTYKERLGLRSQIFFQNHKDTMIKSGSTTKSTYSV
uniref:eIF-4F 25 kDa subunit n=1 Tax=Anopheles farauti TaxID=69004 RepID=A0A182R162_9DIPT